VTLDDGDDGLKRALVVSLRIAASAAASNISRRVLFVVDSGDVGESRRNHEVADSGGLLGVWMVLFCFGVSRLWGELIVLCTGGDDEVVHVSMELEFTGRPPIIVVSPIV